MQALADICALIWKEPWRDCSAVCADWLKSAKTSTHRASFKRSFIDLIGCSTHHKNAWWVRDHRDQRCATDTHFYISWFKVQNNILLQYSWTAPLLSEDVRHKQYSHTSLRQLNLHDNILKLKMHSEKQTHTRHTWYTKSINSCFFVRANIFKILLSGFYYARY